MSNWWASGKISLLQPSNQLRVEYVSSSFKS